MDASRAFAKSEASFANFSAVFSCSRRANPNALSSSSFARRSAKRRALASGSIDGIAPEMGAEELDDDIAEKWYLRQKQIDLYKM
jgi:hypothetical protein